MNRNSQSSASSGDQLAAALGNLLEDNDVRFAASASRRLFRFLIHGAVTGEWRIQVEIDPLCMVASCRLPVAVPKSLAPAAHRIASRLNLSQNHGTWVFSEGTGRFLLRVCVPALPGHDARDVVEFCLQVSSALFDGAAPWLARFALGALGADAALDRICSGWEADQYPGLAPHAPGVNPGLN